MDHYLSRASDLEAGLAGCPATPTSLSMEEKSRRNLSASSTDSSTKPLKPTPNSECAPSLARSLWTTLCSAPTRVGLWTARSQQDEAARQDVRTLDACPAGYPRLAAFLDSDDCFSVYRRFGFLQSRLLLNKQDKLRQLEEALDSLDLSEAKADEHRPQTRDLPEEVGARRQRLLTAIEGEFTSYANLVDIAAKMMTLNRPSDADYKSVWTHMDNRKPIARPESTWVNKKEDLITLRAGREHAWLDSVIEKCLQYLRFLPLQSIFGDERTRQKSSGDEIYYSRQRIANLASSIITFMVLLLLVVPIYLLYHLINEVKNPDGRIYAICLGILLISTLAFSAVLCLFTRAKRHEVLAAAAAYCAVLVVFFGNVPIAKP